MRSWLLFFIAFPANLFSQPSPAIVDLDRIPQEKVRVLIKENYTSGNELQYNLIQPTYRKGQSLDGYRFLESAYVYHETPEKVWKCYQTTSPARSWNGNMISFGLLVSKSDEKIMYHDDVAFSGIDTGQVFYVNLRILKGLYNLAVGLEIIDIDSVRRCITYSYIKGGKSLGEQTIYFKPAPRGKTAIIHTTAVRGHSFIRDRYLYPYFHRKAINEFHRNMKKCLVQNNKRAGISPV